MNRFASVLLVCAVMLPAPLAAQDGPRWGLGMGISQTSIVFDDEIGVLSSLAPSVYIPVVLGSGIMIEPGVGLIRIKSEDSEFDEQITSTALRASVGVLFALATPDRGRFYVGPRIGVLRIKSTFEGEGEDGEMSRMDLMFAAVAGGEGFITQAVSLGGEAGLTYYSVGETEFDPDPGFEDDDDMSMLSLGAEFRVRWYIR